MKSNRGVTLTSLVIYVIGLVAIIGLLSLFTGYFYGNVNEITISQDAHEQYARLLAYVTKDVNSNNITYVQSNIEDEDCVIFKFGEDVEHQYIYKNNTIYYINTDEENEKKIILCENVETTVAKVFNYINGKLNINFQIENENFEAVLNIKN